MFFIYNDAGDVTSTINTPMVEEYKKVLANNGQRFVYEPDAPKADIRKLVVVDGHVYQRVEMGVTHSLSGTTLTLRDVPRNAELIIDGLSYGYQKDPEIELELEAGHSYEVVLKSPLCLDYVVNTGIV